MRTLAVVCLAAALLVAGLRLFTGVVYEEDEPTSYLVRRAPGEPIERKATPQSPVDRKRVLYAEEPTLPWERAYLGLMHWAPEAGAALLLGAAVFAAGGTGRRRGARRRHNAA